MKKGLTILIGCILLTAKLFAQPVISNINPASGPIGSSITINGTGFSTVPADNIVYFGSVRASVSAATASALSVIVPTGLNAAPVTVTVNNLTAFSSVPFDVTFAGGGPFNAGSFAARTDITSPGAPRTIASADLDGDNKPEMVVAGYTGNTLSVFKNASNATTISFPSKTDITIGFYPASLAIGDIDGDGLPDIVAGVSASGSYKYVVLRNTTSGGILSFAPGVEYALAATPYQICIGEIDGDGKPDIVITGSPGVLIFRNTSVPGSVSFNPVIVVNSAATPNGLAIADINANGKMDIVACYNVPTNSVGVYNNISTPGVIAFDAPLSYASAFLPMAVAVGNLDNDGKPDIAVISYNSSSVVSVFKNSSTGGVISLDPRQDLPANSYGWDITIADLDGDGRMDIITGYEDNIVNKISVFRNIGSGNTITMAARFDYSPTSSTRKLSVTDLNNDGRLDIAATQMNSNSFTVYRNKIGDPPVITSFSPVTAGPGTTVTITGTNLSNVNAVSFGGVAAPAFNIISDLSINATVGPGSSGDVTVIAPQGTSTLSGFTFIPAPGITGINPASGTVGSGVTITGSGFSTTPADNIVYFGSAKALVNSSTATSLNVTVPPYASFQKISATNNSLTSWSKKPFNITFDSILPITPTSFVRRVYTSSPGLDNANNLLTADIDGDGKADLVTHTYTDDRMLVFRNTTTNNTVSFASAVGFYSNNSHTVNAAIADFTGDGKLDVIVPNDWGGLLSAFRNTSVPGTISFASADFFGSGASYPTFIGTGDLDADGKPDIAVAFNSSQAMAVRRNTSTTAGISFANFIVLSAAEFGGSCVYIEDIDGDNKQDIVLTYEYGNIYSIFRNTSTGPGDISFAPRIDLPTTYANMFVSIADLDNDNRPDLVMSSGYFVTIFKNQSTPGNISLAQVISIPKSTPYANTVAINDLNGDKLPDIISTSGDSLCIFKNSSTVGNIVFDTAVRYYNNYFTLAEGIASGDLNGDGKPDIAALSPSLCVFINQFAPDLVLCPPAGSGNITSNINGASYQWKVDMGSGYVNVTNGANYVGATGPTLFLVNAPSSWTGYKYRCTVGANNSRVSTLRFENKWTGAVNTAWENPGNWSCGTVPDMYTDVIITGGIIEINSNVTIRTLQLEPGAYVTIYPPYILTVTH